jgi:hypothetical protein
MTPRPPEAPAVVPTHTPHQLVPYGFPQHFYALPPPPYIPPPAPSSTLHPPWVLPTPPGTTPLTPPATGFLGIPGSKLVCGADIGFDDLPGHRYCHCAIVGHYPGSLHCCFGSPLRYWARYNGCPGWTASGHRIPAAWVGPKLTRQTRTEWIASSGNTASPTPEPWPGQWSLSEQSPAFAPCQEPHLQERRLAKPKPR